MKVLQVTCVGLATLCYAGTGIAADIIEFPSQSGKVIFTHKKHQEAIKYCTVCHKTKPVAIKEFMQYPHGFCIGCHEKMKSGPTICLGCHRDAGSGDYR